LVGLASSLRKVDPDNMTFLQVPSAGGLPAPNQGRVALVQDQAQILFDKLKADEPLVLAKSNPGAGASTSAAPSASATPAASASSSALPDWVRGTKGSSSTCSN
jgi:hypothetical protein